MLNCSVLIIRFSLCRKYFEGFLRFCMFVRFCLILGVILFMFEDMFCVGIILFIF